MTPLHERLEPLSFLVGTWHGLGVVGDPTIELRSDVVARTDAATPKC
ncbi:hypothetical protein [uncultured Arthrobacter sp.]